MFGLDDRLQLLAERLARKETPDKSTERERSPSTTRRSLLPAEERANARASKAVENMRDSEQGPRGIQRATTLVESPGGQGVDGDLWKRVSNQQATGGVELSPEMAARFGEQLGDDASKIRIHTDGAADEICRSAKSEVVARGNDIFFARSTPMPGTAQGDELLAQAIAQLAVDSRTARDEQPMRRYVDVDPSENQERPVEEDPQRSGLGLLGIVGGLASLKETHDRRREAKAQEADAELARQRSEAERRAKAAGEQRPGDGLARDLQNADHRQDQDAAARDQMGAATERDRTELAALDAATRAQAAGMLKDLVNGAESQMEAQEQLPDQVAGATDDRAEDLALLAGAATQALDELRPSADDSQRDEAKEQQRAEGGVDLEVGLDGPLEVEGNYRARWNQTEDNTDASQVDVDEHQLVMTSEVADAAREFEEDAFGPDLSVTVDRIVERIEDELADGDVAEHETERLDDDLDRRRDGLASVIEQRVRDAASANRDDEQAEEELRLELEAGEATEAGEQTEGDDTFTFGARIDLATGDVVVTTNDSIPTSTEAAPSAAAPSIAGGDGGGGSGGAGSGGGGSGGGGGGGGGGAA